MKVTLNSTTLITELNGIPCRVWEGETETGIKCHAYITRIAIDKDEPRAWEFEKKLIECDPPSYKVEAIPAKLII